jgi:pimeloyl-ACP methyl ester carboxylesterase
MNHEITLTLPYTNLKALTWGDPTKPTILALHVWLDNAASYTHLAPLLTDYYVVAVDMIVHGHSEHIPDGQHLHLADTVELIIQILKVLNLEKVILMGHSLGGVIASLVASSFPEKVSTLIMLDAIGPMSEESIECPGRLRDAVTAFNAAEKHQAKVYKNKDLMVNLRCKLNSVSAELMLPLVERAVRKTEHGYSWRFDRKLSLPSLTYFTEEQVLAYLIAIEAPTLIVEATDGILQKNDLLIKRKAVFQDLTVVVTPGAHHVHMSHAAVVAEIVLDYLWREG